MPDFEGKPIRMRGYYRAVKRGVPWATKIARLIEKNPVSGLLALCYRNFDFRDLIYKESVLFRSLVKKPEFGGKYIPVPFKIK